MDSTSQHLLEIESILRERETLIAQYIDTVLDQDVSEYPILIWHSEHEVAAGVLLLEDLDPGEWSVRISTLEELSSKNLIRSERVDDFLKVYQDPKLKYCMLIVHEGQAVFSFLPRRQL